MARYNRSQSAMDPVSRFFPQNFSGLRGLGQDAPDDDYFTGIEYFTGGNAGAWPAKWEYGVTNTGPAPSGINWSQIPAMLRDLYVSASAADVQKKLLEINLERARRGQPPLNTAAYAPSMNIGVRPATLQAAGLGTLALIGVALAGAYYIASAPKRSRRA